MDQMYRVLIPYSDKLELAEKILHMYNGYLEAVGRVKDIIDGRHIQLMSYYLVFGYSMETRDKFCHTNGCKEQYARVLDVQLKDKGHLVDDGRNYRSRKISNELEDIRRVAILSGEDKFAMVPLFYRSISKSAKGGA